MNEADEQEQRETEAQAEERMAKITDEYFANKNGDIENPELEGEQPPVTTEEAPPAEGEAPAPEAGKSEPEATTEPAVAPEGDAAQEVQEAAATPPPEQPPTEAPKDEFDAELEAFTAELEKGPKAKKDAHPNTQKAIAHYRKKAREAKEAEVAAKREAKKSAEERAALKVLDPETEKTLEELRTFRRNVDIEHDPEFVAKYVKGTEELQTQAMTVLESAGILPEATKNFIQEKGGLLRFRSSSTPMPSGLKDGNGALITKPDGSPLTHAEFYRHHIETHLLPEQREAITEIGLEARKLDRQKTQELNEAKAKGETLFRERAETQQKQRDEWQAKVKEAALAEVAKLGAVAQKKPVPSNATAVEKAIIDAQNSKIDRAAGITQRFLSDVTPANLAAMAVTKAYHETVYPDLMKEKDQQIADLQKRATTAETKLNNIYKAGQTSDKDNAPIEASNKPRETSQIEDPGERMAAMMNAK